MPAVCVTSAFTVVASTAPAVFRFAAVTVGAVRMPVADTSSVWPAAVTDVAAETVPAMSAPPLSVSVSDEVTEPPVCVSFPPTVKAPSFATTVPPFCFSSPVTVPTVTCPSSCVREPSSFAVASVPAVTMASPVTESVAVTVPPDCSRRAARVAVETCPASTASVPAATSAVAVTLAAPFTVTVWSAASIRVADTVPKIVVAFFSVSVVVETALISMPSAAPRTTSPSVATMEPSAAIFPADVALTLLPCRSLPEAMDICLWPTTSDVPAFACVRKSMSPLAMTAPLTAIVPSVTAVRFPSCVSSPICRSPSSIPIPVSSSAKSAIRTEILPPATSSIASLPPAASVNWLTPVKSAPSASATDFPMNAACGAETTAPPSICTVPEAVPGCGAGIAVPASIAASMSDWLDSPALATAKSPPTLTLAPFRNDTPAGLKIHSAPLAFSVPAIWEAFPPDTTLKNCAPWKSSDCPEPMFRACQSINPVPEDEIVAADNSAFGMTVAPLA